MSLIKVVECPRDAMQGIRKWIPTNEKISYIQSILSVGFDVVDFGSFVSERAVPQMKDTHLVLENLDLNSTRSKLLAIVANIRGAKNACKYSQINYLGYPFSISEYFQMRNTNKSIEESLLSAEKARKELENINQESESILMKAKTEAQSIVGEAKSAADNMKEDIVSKARSEAEGQLEKAKIQINVEKDKAMAEIREEVVNLSIHVAEKIIKKNISKEENVELIKKSLDSMEGYEA